MAAEIETYAARAVAAAPNDSFALQRSAMSLQMIGKHEVALRHIEAAIARNPRDIELRLVLRHDPHLPRRTCHGLTEIEERRQRAEFWPPVFGAHWRMHVSSMAISPDVFEVWRNFANPPYYVHLFSAQRWPAWSHREARAHSSVLDRAPASYSPNLSFA